ncbi:hypothetical protein RchiOBHm_Chr6g0292731 [Rosa chinensis]|uniref:Uncharacterized protein n=1 Tax=Rosa chinensis TaxID=74649 RepID=A0A2P6PWH9_ROSCH|nr:hypothetical protein RchiOBHm_Chr6g0292731 [Rosa chinensis]
MIHAPGCCRFDLADNAAGLHIETQNPIGSGHHRHRHVLLWLGRPTSTATITAAVAVSVVVVVVVVAASVCVVVVVSRPRPADGLGIVVLVVIEIRSLGSRPLHVLGFSALSNFEHCGCRIQGLWGSDCSKLK